jgi:HK97 family phage prohead protease
MKFREVIEPRAFAESVANGADVMFRLEHGQADHPEPFGSVGDGKLEVKETSRGIDFRFLVDHDDERDMTMYRALQNREYPGLSFAFRAQRDTWPAIDRRHVTKADLIDISPVREAAYAQPKYELRRKLFEALGVHHISTRGRFAEDVERRLEDARRLPAYCRDGAIEQIQAEFWRLEGRELRHDAQREEIRTIFSEFILD